MKQTSGWVECLKQVGHYTTYPSPPPHDLLPCLLERCRRTVGKCWSFRSNFFMQSQSSPRIVKYSTMFSDPLTFVLLEREEDTLCCQGLFFFFACVSLSHRQNSGCSKCSTEYPWPYTTLRLSVCGSTHTSKCYFLFIFFLNPLRLFDWDQCLNCVSAQLVLCYWPLLSSPSTQISN